MALRAFPATVPGIGGLIYRCNVPMRWLVQPLYARNEWKNGKKQTELLPLFLIVWCDVLAFCDPFCVTLGIMLEGRGAIWTTFGHPGRHFDTLGPPRATKHEKSHLGAESAMTVGPIWCSIRGHFGALFRKLRKNVSQKAVPEKNSEKVTQKVTKPTGAHL